MLILINLFFGFASGGSIDNAAHVGGLAAGLWLGALIVPGGVPTLSSLWHRPGSATAAGATRAGAPALMVVVGVGVVALVVAAGIAVGTADRRSDLGSVEWRSTVVEHGIRAAVSGLGDG
jgi:hypothetical protein